MGCPFSDLWIEGCCHSLNSFPDSKVHGANMGTTWVLSTPDGPHVGPMNLAIRVVLPVSTFHIPTLLILWRLSGCLLAGSLGISSPRHCFVMTHMGFVMFVYKYYCLFHTLKLELCRLVPELIIIWHNSPFGMPRPCPTKDKYICHDSHQISWHFHPRKQIPWHFA